MQISIQEALKKAIAAHRAGELLEADKFYSAILKAQPKHADANHNLGVLAVGVGKVLEGLPYLENALKSNPDIAQFWLSYIDALIRAENYKEAHTHIKDALARSFNTETVNKLQATLSDLMEKQSINIGSNQISDQNLETISSKNVKYSTAEEQEISRLEKLYIEGRFQAVKTFALELLRNDQSAFVVQNILGAANISLNELDEAIVNFKTALEINPNYFPAYTNLGNVLHRTGDLVGSIDMYSKAIALNPKSAETHNNLGEAFRELGETGKSIIQYSQAIALKKDFKQPYYNLAKALSHRKFLEPVGELHEKITAILDHKSLVKPTDIAPAAISLLKAEPTLQELLTDIELEDLNQIITRICEFPLFLKIITVGPINDLDFENFLIKIRHRLLNNLVHEQTHISALHFRSALALQCHANEYVYEHSEAELKMLSVLEDSIKRSLEQEQQPTPEMVLCFAGYKSLNETEWSNLLIPNSAIADVMQRHIEEPSEEEKYKKEILNNSEIVDKVSLLVRTQYESNPYPRWIQVGTAFEPGTISSRVKEMNLKLVNFSICSRTSPDILIAGCGTGQHAIQTAARFKASNVIAIDLSLSSLAYAKRKIVELGLSNIELMQADILSLDNLNTKFDIIESVGVLHHMNDPLAGWKVLSGLLKDGGLMKLGLYSKLAREHITKIRAEIKKLNLEVSDLRSYRSVIKNSKFDHHKLITESQDFYSVSAIRDLLFHVQEHQFSIPQIKSHLGELNLQFCGFEGDGLLDEFKSYYSTSVDPMCLDNWHNYEVSRPRTFAGMYQFWCQKS